MGFTDRDLEEARRQLAAGRARVRRLERILARARAAGRPDGHAATLLMTMHQTVVLLEEQLIVVMAALLR